jgi:O-antigen/teichoic acid export membrane protein
VTGPAPSPDGFEDLRGSVQRPLARNLTSLWLSRGFGFAVQLVAFGVIAAHLGPAGFGVYAFAIAFAELVRVVPDFGLGPIVTRDIAQDPRREAELLPNLLYVRLLLALVAYGAVAAALTAGGFQAQERDAALLASLGLVVQPLSFGRAALEARMRIGRLAVVEAVRALAFAAGAVSLAAASAGVLAFIWLYLVTTVGAELVIVGLALAVARVRWAVRLPVWWETLRASAPLALAGLFIALYYRLDMILLGALKAQADVGQYGAAYRFLEAFAILASMVAVVLGPVWARSFVESPRVLQLRYERVVRLALQVALPIGIAGSLTAWRLLPRLPGFGGYDGGGVALSVLSAAAAFIFLASIAQGILISAHLQRRLLVISSWGFALNLALNLALIPPYSYVGAAVATTATEAVVMVLSLWALRARLDLAWPAQAFVRTLVPGAAMTVALVAGFAVPVEAQLLAGVAAYVAVAFAVGTVTRDDVRVFVPGLGRRRSVTSAGH